MRRSVRAPTPAPRVPGIMAEPETSTQGSRTPQASAPSAATVAAASAPPVAAGSVAGGSSDPVRPGLSQQQRASQRKAHARSFPRAKKLEKLGVFSACKVRGPVGDKGSWEFLLLSWSSHCDILSWTMKKVFWTRNSLITCSSLSNTYLFKILFMF